MRETFDFATIRIAPRVDREEFINAGVILFCLRKKFLSAMVKLDEGRLKALWPEVDLDEVRRHLESIPKVCQGEGPIGQLTIRERFHWLVSPRSTVIQVSAVHTGLCEDPARALEDLFAKLVA